MHEKDFGAEEEGMMYSIIKYPRTPHLEKSRLQPGDEDCSQVPYSELEGKFITVEEKEDGANSGIRFSEELSLLLQSRGHYLTGGYRERHFNLFKSWATAHQERLFDLLDVRYVMYGEWMYSKHTIFYDNLPHYWHEFDIYDTVDECFLSTDARRVLIGDAPILSVPVLYSGTAPAMLKELVEMVRPSLAKTSQWRETLIKVAEKQGLDVERVLAETDNSDLAEGLYIKVEEGSRCVGRYKWIRSSFTQTILDNDEHWASRPIIPNQLAPGVDMFSDRLTVDWSSLK